MTAQLTHYHHHGLPDDFTIVGYPGGYDSGVVLVEDQDGARHPEAVSGIERVGVNIPRLLAELRFVTEHPEQHRQAYWMLRSPEWACGTAGCLAGWTVVHEGIALRFYDSPWMEAPESATATAGGDSILEVAGDILGLNEDEAARLFAGDNSLHDLWRIARDITQGAIEIPSDVEAQS